MTVVGLDELDLLRQNLHQEFAAEMEKEHTERREHEEELEEKIQKLQKQESLV